MAMFGKLFRIEDVINDEDNDEDKEDKNFLYSKQISPLTEKLMEKVNMLGSHYVSLSSRMLIKLD